jgi:hypothetical protein
MFISPWVILLYPDGLVVLYNALFLGGSYKEPLSSQLVWVCYCLYIFHFLITMTAPTKRIFFWLMVILVVVVALNITGCAMMWQGGPIN